MISQKQKGFLKLNQFILLQALPFYDTSFMAFDYK